MREIKKILEKLGKIHLFCEGGVGGGVGGMYFLERDPKHHLSLLREFLKGKNLLPGPRKFTLKYQ